MLRPLPTRQRIRKSLLILAFLSFPVTMNFFSPYVIIDGALNGIVNGSLVMFSLMFISSLFLGRLWCSWLCPGGAMGEIVEPVNSRAVNPRKIGWIKWLVWIPWVSIIAWLVIQAGGYRSVNLLLHTESGISVAGTPDRPILFAYTIYYLVIALFVGLAVAGGRRAGCHTICWMAPFLILGRWIRNRFGWPALHLAASPEACKDCKQCTSRCPMSLDVNAMVHQGNMENSDCILCGTCIDHCSQKAIRYSFSPGK